MRIIKKIGVQAGTTGEGYVQDNVSGAVIVGVMGDKDGNMELQVTAAVEATAFLGEETWYFKIENGGISYALEISRR